MNIEICKKCKHVPTIFVTDDDNYTVHCLPLNFPLADDNEKIVEGVYLFTKEYRQYYKLRYLHSIKPYEDYGLKLCEDMAPDVMPNHNCKYFVEHQIMDLNKSGQDDK